MPVDLPNGSHLDWEKVSRKLDADLTSCEVSVVHEGIWMTVTALKEDYDKAVSWISDILYGTVFDIDRLKNLVNTKLQVLPSIKQDGSRMAKAAVRTVSFSKAR